MIKRSFKIRNMSPFSVNRIKNFTLLATFFLIFLHSNSSVAEQNSELRTITITAGGKISASPDLAKLQSGLVTEDISARVALSKNTQSMINLIDNLKSKGIEGKDIQTTSFQIEPRYTSPRDNTPSVINGYRVVNQVEIIIRNLQFIGELIDQMVTLGANQIGGLSFEVSTEEELRDTARKDAVRNAYRRAELYAIATKTKLGKVTKITEGEVSTPQPFLRAARAVTAEAIPIEKGSISLESSVTITWELE